MRVDEALGFGYFRGFYGRSNDVFGAVPSLHVAYPLLIVLGGYKHFSAWTKALSILFFLSMCVAAVYLDHHWVIDVILGIFYTLVVFFGIKKVWRSRVFRKFHMLPSALKGQKSESYT